MCVQVQRLYPSACVHEHQVNEERKRVAFAAFCIHSLFCLSWLCVPLVLRWFSRMPLYPGSGPPISDTVLHLLCPSRGYISQTLLLTGPLYSSVLAYLHDTSYGAQNSLL
ncbi:hypothetical protein TRVL_01575 [Trypanosoma vivax]|nr:hypothetical protein TRVL_01575 [Trypanosoma vivax]